MNYTFTRIDSDDGLTRDTIYLPDDTEEARLLRKIAVSLYRHLHLLRAAYVDHALKPIILLPKYWLPHSLGKATSGTVMDVPWRLCGDIEAPMLAYELELRDLP